ncbi:MAG: glycosyltransferase [Actinobacteria bacterium]|nr:glycosyltransferase [Actinomycetota bacterium]
MSIVTPCYNSARYIQGCIESVLAQDYPRIEHIVQDGGSTDGTIEILRQYDGRIDWISEPDEGQADGLNRALQRSKGEIILVLNADDELLPGAVSWAVENMACYPDAAVVYGDLLFMGENGEDLGMFLGPDPYDFKKVLCVEQVPPAQAAFIRRTHFEQVGLYADKSLVTCPDYEMWIRIGMRFPMKHIPGFLARYRLHPGSGGRQIEEIPKMYQTKRMVMDRVFDDPETPLEIRKLRKRAYAGVASWTADTLLSIGYRWKAFQYALKGYLVMPGKYQAWVLRRYMLLLLPRPVRRWVGRQALKIFGRIPYGAE